MGYVKTVKGWFDGKNEMIEKPMKTPSEKISVTKKLNFNSKMPNQFGEVPENQGKSLLHKRHLYNKLENLQTAGTSTEISIDIGGKNPNWEMFFIPKIPLLALIVQYMRILKIWKGPVLKMMKIYLVLRTRGRGIK